MYGINPLKITGIATGKSEYTEKEIYLHKKKAKELMDKGYRKVSVKHCVLSRIDKTNWREIMAEEYAPWSKEEGEHWVRIMGKAAADHYRRVYSNDKISITLEVARWVLTSSHDTTEYLEK